MASTKEVEVGELAKSLAQLEQKFKRLAEGTRADRLSNSSFDIRSGRGYIPIYEGDVERGRIGLMPDDTVAFVSVNSPNGPAKPKKPIVTPEIGGATVYCNGLEGEQEPNLPYDFAYVDILVDGESQGKFSTLPDTFFITLDYDSTHTVQLIAYNQSGKASEGTEFVYVIPNKVVGADILDGIITDLKIANDAIKEVHVQANAITTSKISDDAITTPKLVASSVITSKIAALAVNADKVAANAITADKIAANAVSADKILANAITAGKIQAGAVTASKLESSLVLASRIIAGNSEMNSSGFLTKNSSGQTTFQATTAGDILMMGVFRTGLTGERITLNEANSNQFRFYPSSGSNYATIDSFTGIQGTTYVGGIYMAGGLYLGIKPVMQLAGNAILGQAVSNNQILTCVSVSTGNIEHYISANGSFNMGNNGNNDPVLWSSKNGTAILYQVSGIDILQYNGAYRAIGASAFVQQSSAEAKQNQRKLSFNALKAIKNAPAQMYEYKDDTRTNIGPMAEDLPKDALTTMPDGKTMAVSLDVKIGMLWAAMEEVSDLILTLKGRLGMS